MRAAIVTYAIATMYKYTFQIFWLGEFSVPNISFTKFSKVEDAFAYLAGFADIEAFTVEEYFAGAHASG